MIGEPKPTQRQRLLEARVAQAEASVREMKAQVSELGDQVLMMRYHLSGERPPTAARPADSVLQ